RMLKWPLYRSSSWMCDLGGRTTSCRPCAASPASITSKMERLSGKSARTCRRSRKRNSTLAMQLPRRGLGELGDLGSVEGVDLLDELIRVGLSDVEILRDLAFLDPEPGHLLPLGVVEIGRAHV